MMKADKRYMAIYIYESKYRADMAHVGVSEADGRAGGGARLCLGRPRRRQEEASAELLLACPCIHGCLALRLHRHRSNPPAACVPEGEGPIWPDRACAAGPGHGPLGL